MAMPEPVRPDVSNLGAVIGDAALRAKLVRFVRTRVPEAEAEDIVQTTLTDALASKHAPEAREEIERWLHGIAKNKIVDHFRKHRREVPHDGELEDEVVAESAPLGARDLLRWAESELPEGEGADSTLEWMLREADGEKLEHIAAEAKMPAPRVRQRVTRMRKHYRRRWAAQLAAVAAVVVLVLAAIALYTRRISPDHEEIVKEVVPQVDHARELRRAGLDDCDHARWQPCVDKLDQARTLDPAGDTAPRIVEARKAAADALARKNAPLPSAVPEPVPQQNAPAPSAVPGPVPTAAPKVAPKAAPKPTAAPMPAKPVPQQPTNSAPPRQKSKKSFDPKSMGSSL